MLHAIFIFLAIILLAFLSLKHHTAAIVLLTGLLPTYLLRLSIFGLPTSFLELAIITIAITGLLQVSVRQSWRVAWRRLPTPFIIFLGLFMISTIVSTYISPHPYTSLGILKGWILFPLIFGWLIVTIAPYKTSQIINALIASGTAMSLVGLMQINGLNRIKGVYDVPNSLALYLAPIFIMVLWQSTRAFKAHQKIEKITFILASLIIGGALIATQSAAAIAAITISLLLGIFYWANPLFKKRWLVLATLFVVVAASYLFFTGRLAYLVSPLRAEGPSNSISVRVQLWDLSQQLIKEHPLLGIGLGSFEPAYQQKLHERFQEFENCNLQHKNCIQPIAEYVFRDPHNWVLSFWLNTGLLGLFSFIFINAYVFWRAKNTTLTQQSILLALLVLLLFGLTDTIYWKNDLSALHWTILALLIAQSYNKATSDVV
jgi:O-antigen ligase